MKPISRPGDSEPQETHDLIVRARKGSLEALGQLLELFRPYLLKVAFEEVDSDLRVKESPSDLVQKSCMEAFQGFGGFHGDSPEVLQAWLRQILLNNIQDLLGRYHTEKRQIDREIGGMTEVLAPVLAGDLTPPSQVAIRREQKLELEAALNRLAPEDRDMIVLRHREGRSFAEIATHLGISDVAARKRWARAVEELRQLTLAASFSAREGEAPAEP